MICNIRIDNMVRATVTDEHGVIYDIEPDAEGKHVRVTAASCAYEGMPEHIAEQAERIESTNYKNSTSAVLDLLDSRVLGCS